MGERELGLRRVTMITGGLAVASIAGTLGVAVVAHADHTADQNADIPAGSVEGGTLPQPVGTDGQPAPADDAAPDRPVEQTSPTADFPPVTGGGGEPGQATSGGS